MHSIEAVATGRATVEVPLGVRSYPIKIGPGVLADAGRLVGSTLPGARLAIVTDEMVAPLHLATLQAALDAAGLAHVSLTLPAGETTKSFEHLQRTVGFLLDERLERGDGVIALGGGVIGDLTGFAAAITRRGMQFMQAPTSLLAQVDSSVGGKTGINTGHGKNLVGAFYQPRLVLADTGVLDTLSAREFRAGYAEVVKYGLINQPDFFDWLDANMDAIFAGGAERVKAVARACRSKAEIVARDEHEAGERALLNLGHTFGHALEGIAAYDPSVLVHGEGVSIGMVLAHRFSERLGLCPAADTQRVIAHLERAGLPTDLSMVRARITDTDQLMRFIAQDKKVSRGALTFILTHGIGKAHVARDVPAAQVEAFLSDMLES